VVLLKAAVRQWAALALAASRLAARLAAVVPVAQWTLANA
jgi:hypothetical protein